MGKGMSGKKFYESESERLSQTMTGRGGVVALVVLALLVVAWLVLGVFGVEVSWL